MNESGDIPINDIISPFLTGKYERIKENILDCYKDLYISDYKNVDNYEISYTFTELMIEAMKPENKILTYFFVQNNSHEIIKKIRSFF